MSKRYYKINLTYFFPPSTKSPLRHYTLLGHTLDIIAVGIVTVAFYQILIGMIRDVHHDVINWKHFPRYWPFVWGIHRSPMTSPDKGQWRGAMMFSLIWINVWVNNREAGDLRRYCAHYAVTVMPYMEMPCMTHLTVELRYSHVHSGILIMSQSHLPFNMLGFVTYICFSGQVWVMLCHLFGTNLSPKPILIYSQPNPWKRSEVLSKHINFRSRRCIWEYSLQNCAQLVTFEMCS